MQNKTEKIYYDNINIHDVLKNKNIKKCKNVKHKTIDLYFWNMKQIFKYNRFFTIAQNKYANIKSHLPL